MKKSSKILINLIFLLITINCFYQINTLNYKKHNEIKKSFINHPENLPLKEVAVNTSLGFKNLKADIYWLETIQYIGSNALGSEYKKYLFVIIDLITELNPYFEHPYSIGQLLIPAYNARYENLKSEEQIKNINQGVALGLKGIKNFCDPKKIQLIEDEPNLEKIWTEDKYANPCTEYKIPYYLAYIYYYYKKNPTQAGKYYKIASAIRDGLTGSRVMSAIMTGKGGEREKSYFMFLNIAKFIESEDEVCIKLSSTLENLGKEIFINKKIILNSSIIKNIGIARDKVFGVFNEENQDNLLSDTKCGNYLNKAIRELNLKYIENADKKYLEKNGKHSKNAKVLFDEGFIDYIPLDYQQYKDHSIIYEYNPETGNYDYIMGNYDD